MLQNCILFCFIPSLKNFSSLSFLIRKPSVHNLLILYFVFVNNRLHAFTAFPCFVTNFIKCYSSVTLNKVTTSYIFSWGVGFWSTWKSFLCIISIIRKGRVLHKNSCFRIKSHCRMCTILVHCWLLCKTLFVLTFSFITNSMMCCTTAIGFVE